jgi:thiamine biosynthesis lipoprotein ApbE
LRSGPAAASPALPGPWPSPAALDSALALARDGGAYFVDLGVLLRSPGMAIDLDPLLDGVLADRAADSLRALGQTGLRLRVGKVWRDDGIGKPWELPLVDPLTRGELGRVELAGRSLALADLTTPALTLEGRPVAELVDPRSGLPAGGADVGVTAAWALADSGEKARAWANTLALLGPEEGLPLLATAPGVEGAVLFSREGRPAWRASAGFPLQSPRGIPAAR